MNTETVSGAADEAAQVADSFTHLLLPDVARALVLAVLGALILYICGKYVSKWALKRYGKHAAFLARKLIYYGGGVLLLISVLSTLKINLTAIMGAAGIVSVAVGFAAQTSLSNLISGLFLIAEKPFKVGDLIRVNGITGTVASIDLLSVKLQTPDNLFVRMPNETLVKSDFTTITRYDVRRLDVSVGISYHDDIRQTMALLKTVADGCAYRAKIDGRETLVTVTEFGDSSINILVGVWVKKENFFNLRNELIPAIKEAFDLAKITIPFPQLTITGPDDGSHLPFDIRKID